jgi:hypothetical protein
MSFSIHTLVAGLNDIPGFLFRAHPTLMTKESSAEMMDAIFESTAIEGRARLLKIMQDFLTSESSKALTQQKCLSFSGIR